MDNLDNIYIELKANKVLPRKQVKTIDEKIKNIIFKNSSVLSEMFSDEQEGFYANKISCLCINLNDYTLDIYDKDNVGKKHVVYTAQAKSSYDMFVGNGFDEWCDIIEENIIELLMKRQK